MRKKKTKKTDQAILLGKNGGETRILRIREDEGGTSVEIGRIQDTEGMTPEEIRGSEVIGLKHRKGTPLHDVEVLQEGTSHKGPARVATQAYRKGWDAIFGNDEVPEGVTWN